MRVVSEEKQDAYGSQKHFHACKPDGYTVKYDLYHEPIYIIKLHINLRIGLQLNEEGIAEYRKSGDEYHKQGWGTRFHTIALHAWGDARILQNCKGYEKNWTVHFPLALGVRERIELEQGDGTRQEHQEPNVVLVEV